jgi:hypothetical protein
MGRRVSKKVKATCNDCYFRCAGLCALPGDVVCPTFRLRTTGRLAPPPQPPLVARPLVAAPAV